MFMSVGKADGTVVAQQAHGAAQVVALLIFETQPTH
jgi:hypothetical protein